MTQEGNRLYADSTVAVTLYNVLCMVGAMDFEQLHTTAERMQHINLERDQSERVLAELVRRGRVRKADEGKYDVAASARLVVAQRDLGDYDYVTMEGGWEGWQVKDPRVRDGIGFRPIEQLLGQAPTGRKPRPLPPPPPIVEVSE